MNIPEKTVTTLKVERVKRGILQYQLAAMLEIDAAQLSRYESGRERVPLELRYELSRILKVDVDKLFPEDQQ